MTAQTTTRPEAKVDAEIAEAFNAMARAHTALAATLNRVHNLVDMYRWQGRRQVWAMTDADAVAALHATVEGELPLKRGYYSTAQHERTAGTLAEAQAHADQMTANYKKEAARYQGWSRFFLVTSSNGLIHSSMACSTCNNGRQMTTFAWQPQLSGLDEAAAVAELGPYLCSVCFPSAPVAWQSTPDAEKAKAKAATECSGSRTWEYDRATARLGYSYGNAATCGVCGARVAVTRTGKLRGHNPA